MPRFPGSRERAPPGAGVGESVVERRGCLRGPGPRDHRRRARRAGWAGAHARGRRPRVSARPRGADLRAVLHHQGARPRHRAGAGDLPAADGELRGRHPGGAREPGRDLPASLPGGGMSLRNVLVVDDDPGMRQMLTMLLRSKGYVPAAVGSAEAALKEFEARPYDVVLCDVRMPTVDGLAHLEEIQKRSPEATVIMMSAYGSEEVALEAMKRGAYDYVSKPFRQDEVILALRKAEERERLRRENVRLREQLGDRRGLTTLIGQSPAMQELQRSIRK